MSSGIRIFLAISLTLAAILTILAAAFGYADVVIFYDYLKVDIDRYGKAVTQDLTVAHVDKAMTSAKYWTLGMGFFIFALAYGAGALWRPNWDQDLESRSIIELKLLAGQIIHRIQKKMDEDGLAFDIRTLVIPQNTQAQLTAETKVRR